MEAHDDGNDKTVENVIDLFSKDILDKKTVKTTCPLVYEKIQELENLEA